MRLPYPLLTVIALSCWVAGRTTAPKASALESHPRAFGIPGSAYGSLAARLMRDSLYSYWHSGDKAPAPAAPSKINPGEIQAPPPPAPGRFTRRNQPQETTSPATTPAPAMEEAPSGSLLDRGTRLLARLEAARNRHQKPVAFTAAHIRFIEASADWRLRLAYQLDPGDAVLYEILHFQLEKRAATAAEAQKATQKLAQLAMDRALDESGGLSDALTGAGAAINLLNSISQPGMGDKAAASQAWRNLEACLTRYQRIRNEAQADGWWSGIPGARREELDEHARFLEKLAGKFRAKLVQTGILTQAGSH